MGRKFEVRKASMQKTGLAKSKLYTKYSKEIYITAKNGGADPESNLALKHLIERAKKNQIPADVVKRAIDKANSGIEENYQNLRYEGFGPGGSTIIVDCLTDNVNRTISEVKNCFTKTKNKIGVAGSVSHMYDNYGVLIVKNTNEEEIMEVLINHDIDLKDLMDLGNYEVLIYVDASELNKASSSLTDNLNNIDIIKENIEMISQIDTELNEQDLQNFQKLLDMLNEVDDVQEMFYSVTNL